MKIYNYDKTTKEFLSEAEASVNPLDTDNFLTPANATTLQTLVPKTDFSQIFNIDKWEYVEDNRGKTIYSTSSKVKSVIAYLGVIKDGFTKLVPGAFDVWNVDKWEKDLDVEQTSLINIIKAGIQVHIDSKALELGFDNINSIAKFMGYDNTYRAAAESLALWTVSCWEYIEVEFAKTALPIDDINYRTIPTLEVAILELPVYGA